MNSTLASAANAAQRALNSGARSPDLHSTLGWHALQLGDVLTAQTHFGNALALTRTDPEALTGMAQCMRLQGQLRDAILHCDAAIRAKPDYSDAWLERGFVFASGGSMASAKACYEKVIEFNPANIAAHAGVASIMARDGDSPEGRAHATQALAADPFNAIAAAALATMQIESGDAAAALILIKPIAEGQSEISADSSLLFSLLGDAYDKLREPKEAYQAYSRSKAEFATIYAPRFDGRPSHSAYLNGLCEQLAAMPAPSPAQCSPPANAANQHLFLLGYPRSGNTLMENILASLPNVAALEERPTMVEADMAFLTSDDGLTRFAALPETALQPYIDAYWDKVAASGVTAAGQCFVDMDPLKGSRLPLISRLFPQARILLMRRDPRDVVWSCFHTHFALTNAAMDFTTLERAARHYDVMMRLIDTAMQQCPLTVREVHYEALVGNFDSETKAICDFAGVPWSAELRNFDRTARNRGVSTASAGQVRKGLYDGSKQWQRYAEFLEPVVPILQPWIDKFGY